MTNAASASAEVRLKRFLHYGSEGPVCVPGDRFFLNCFLLKNLTAIDEALECATPADETNAVNHIMKAFMDGYSGYPECLVFALAACATQKVSENLRTHAYNAVKTVCKTPRDIFLFAAFTKKLSAPTSGCGSGWRKALSEWYLNKEPLELAACVTEIRGAYGFTHRDLFKLLHIKSSDKAKVAIICYVMKGLEASKVLPDNEHPSVQKVLAYLQAVEDVKHLEDKEMCSCLMDSYKMPKEVAQSEHLKSAEVWMVVVPYMHLGDLLDSLTRLSCSGLLKTGQPLENIIIDRLLDQTAIVESHLHPTEVYCAIKRYEYHAKNTHDMMEKLIKEGKTERELKPAPKPNTKIIDALNKLLTSTLRLLVPTGMRYVVAIDLANNMKQWRCNGSRDVKPANAATLLALCLLHAERDVTVVAFPSLPGLPPEEGLEEAGTRVLTAVSRQGKMKGDVVITPRRTELDDMIPVNLNKDVSVDENLEIMSLAPNGPVEVCQPLVWAQKIKKPVDVFIVLTDYVTTRKRSFKEPFEALQEYRQEMGLPNSKLITCALASNTLSVAVPSDVGMLDIVGFNGKVARIIEAFSRGAF